MSNYHIVMGENRFEVQKEISDLMEKGYVLHGELVVSVVVEPQRHNNARIMLTQAMIIQK